MTRENLHRAKTAAMLARDLALVAPGDAFAQDVLGELRARGLDYVVVSSGDEPFGVLNAERLDKCLAVTPNAENELIGNLAVQDFRICRPDDSTAAVRRRAHGGAAEVVLVIDQLGDLVGVIPAEEL